MKKTAIIFLFSIFFLQCLTASTVYVGPTKFKPNDDIIIKRVSTSSLNFKPGDTVIVKGIYRLNSRPAAKIGLYVTSKEGKYTPTDPKQMQLIHSGRGEFELKIVIPHEGYLHLSFYPGDVGQSFGGTYFGSKDQMAEIADWDLSYYLNR